MTVLPGAVITVEGKPRVVEVVITTVIWGRVAIAAPAPTPTLATYLDTKLPE
jgi:hypothetical protein